MRRIERPVGASRTTLTRPHWSPSFPRGYPERLLLSEYGKALASSVLPEDVYFHHRWLRFEQFGPHLGMRNEAHLKLQRFRFLLAFTACCCSLFLSESGEPVFLEPSSSLADCVGDLIVRDTAHVASTGNACSRFSRQLHLCTKESDKNEIVY